MLSSLYNSSLALLTDFYQLTMAYGYWKTGTDKKQSVFHMFFRQEPFGGGYAIACGLEMLIDFITKFRFQQSDLDYLSTLNGTDNKPLFEEGFLKYLSQLEFSCSVDAMPEGTVVFRNEPLIRVTGPLLQAQILETPLLNIMNYQTLAATKASRIYLASGKSPIFEFGLRRSQSLDGGISATRAAYIGGCSGTSNVIAGKILGIPVSGTHAHSWVMSFESEPEAFRKFAEVMGNNCVLLVDTYDTRTGILNAIEVGKELEKQGNKLIGIRIDSGDLAYLSQMAREMLDQAGMNYVKIIISNDLDEHILESLDDQGARFDIAGVGTKLVTAFDQPALGGVYKLSAIKNEKDEWVSKIKLSEQRLKINIPGIQQVRRYYKNGLMSADMIYDLQLGMKENPWAIDPNDSTRRKHLKASDYHFEDLLVPVYDQGQNVYQSPSIAELRDKTLENLDKLHPAVSRLVNPHTYVVGLEERLYEHRHRLILEQRKLIA